MRVWVTGIAGFLGSHIAENLIKDGHDVGGNDNFVCGDKANIPAGSDYIVDKNGPSIVDCRDFEYMKRILKAFKPDILIHCAATAHEGLSSFSPSFITKNIYEASVATFSAAISAGVGKIIFMSSMARYGNGVPPFTEDEHKTSPVDPYGIAKVAAEDTLKVLCTTHDIDWSILVPHNIIGVRQRYVDPYRNVASIMINRCKQGKAPFVYGDGMQKRCFSPVADCIPSIMNVVNGLASKTVVNIGPDAGEITIADLARKIIKITNFEGGPIFMPGRPNEVKDAFCSSEKARRLLNYKPVQTLDDCLKEMADAITPAPFEYLFPQEIVNEKMPITWKERMM